VVKLVLPPLRERKEDIPLLAEHFIRKFKRLSGKEIRGISPEVLSVLMAHDFPGNIRELEKMIEYATVVCKDHIIGVEHLPDYLRPRADTKIRRVATNHEGKGPSWEELERSFIYDALRRNNWNRTATAAQLGVHPTTLWRKIKRLNIQAPKQGRKKRARQGR